MNAQPLNLLRDFSDRLSPMVVKELRHGLRTRAFTSVLTAFQWVMILIVGAGVLGVEMAIVNNLFWSIALIALLVALPLRGFGTLSGEAQGGTMDMLTLTSISSSRIVWGKWSALFSQTLLLATSLLPYMVARYQFGGVEIVREVMALIIAVLASGVASAAYVAFSSQRSLILRLFLTAGIILALIPVTVFIFIAINDTGGDAILREFFRLGVWEQIGILCGILLLVSYGIFTILALGGSRIAPISENHSTAKRLIHLGMMSFITFSGYALSFHPEDEAVFWAFVPSLFFTLLIGLDLVTEEMPRFPSVVQALSRQRRLGWLLYPGWASGVLFYTLLGILNFSILFAYVTQHSWSDQGQFFCFILCVLCSIVMPICLGINKTNRFANWWVVHIGLAIAGILLSMFVSISREHAFGFLGVITPVSGLLGSMNAYSNDDEIIATTAVIGVFWLIAAVVMACQELPNYTRLEEEADSLTPSPASPEL